MKVATAEEIRGMEKLLGALRRKLGHSECSPMCSAHQLYYRALDYVAVTKGRRLAKLRRRA